MNAWILMVVFLHSYGPRPTLVFQEFTTKERCEEAARQIPAMFEVSKDKINKAVCVPK